MDVCDLSLIGLTEKLASKELTSEEATRSCLQRIDAVDGKVRAFLKVDADGALAQARASDVRRSQGQLRGRLDGVPIALKDMICTAGMTTTAGSRILEGFVPAYDATVVTLLKEAGAVIIGKLNQDEFAMGSSTESSAFFPTHNPWDLTRSPGGSSGGSAAAVAAREVFGTLGTDTGGSIRQPASLTNTVGIKPTYGRVSRYGVVAFASSLDQVGPMARTVADAAAILQVLAVHDPKDSTSAKRPAANYSEKLEAGVKGLRLGLPREYFVRGMDPEVEAGVRAAAEALAKMGAQVTEVTLPHTPYGLAAYYLLAPAEASSNLARYDGVRYGLRAKGASSLRDMYFQTRQSGFGPEVKRRIMLGTYALSAGYYDAYYLKAQKVRTLIRRDFDRAFERVDAIISPTSPVPPFKLGEKMNDPLAMYLLDVFTLPCNLACLPGVSVPCGFTRGNLPFGLQILGKPFDEATVLQIARAFERENDFSRRRPPV